MSKKVKIEKIVTYVLLTKNARIPDELIFCTSGSRGFLRYVRTLIKVVPYFDEFLHIVIAGLRKK